MGAIETFSVIMSLLWNLQMLYVVPLPTVYIETVTITAYTSSVNETDSTPFITASGTHTHWGTLAVSRDLLKKYPYKTNAFIYKHSCKGASPKQLVVEDTMHPRKTQHIDVWMPTLKDAKKWGICKGVVIFWRKNVP